LEELRPLQTTPGLFDFPVFTVAHSFMRTNISVNKEDVADWLLQYPLFFCLFPRREFRYDSFSFFDSFVKKWPRALTQADPG
jgi:hypothetical protein